MRRVIQRGVEARDGLARGAKYLAESVGGTFGPFGYNWFLDKKNTITNDGVTIARDIELPNEVENRGAAAIREAAIKTVDEVGDGTSSACLLSWSIYDVASRLLSKKDVVGKKSPSEVVLQIEKERKEITEKLTEMATPIETKEQLIDSAKVATESDELGKLIGEAQWEIGKDGYLLAETTAERASSFEKIKGVRIDNGFGTSQLINNQEKQILEVEDTKIILTSYTMRDLRPLEKIVNQLLKSGVRTIVVIARAWTDEGIKTCLENINNGALKIYPLNAPYVDMQERFKDLAAVTGARFYDAETSSLEDMQLSDVGYASKVVARRFDAIIAGKEDEESNKRVEMRVEEILEKHKGSQSDFEKKGLLERAAQLKNGFGIIKVGSPSDMETRRLFDKAEDAVHAVRAAFQEGTVKGGGLAFKEIADSLPDTYLLKRPLYCLYEQIISTAPEGFVIEDWVRDPVKVLRVVLEKACAAASSFATAGGVVTQEFPKRLDEILKVHNTPPPAEMQG